MWFARLMTCISLLLAPLASAYGRPVVPGIVHLGQFEDDHGCREGFRGEVISNYISIPLWIDMWDELQKSPVQIILGRDYDWRADDQRFYVLTENELEYKGQNYIVRSEYMVDNIIGDLYQLPNGSTSNHHYDLIQPGQVLEPCGNVYKWWRAALEITNLQTGATASGLWMTGRGVGRDGRVGNPLTPSVPEPCLGPLALMAIFGAVVRAGRHGIPANVQ